MTESYTILERSIARVLGRMPLVKKLAKEIYARAMHRINKKDHCFKAIYQPNVVSGTTEVSFFGYYDKSPVTTDGYLLFHRHEGMTAKEVLRNNFPISICLISPGGNGKIVWLEHSRAFNLQQGCRTHWLNNELFIFNDFDSENQRYIARVFSRETLQETKRFDYPVQDSFSTDYFLSINYRRLLALRPDYGYRNLSPLNRRELADVTNDGIWRVEFDSGDAKILYSLSQIRDVDKKPVFDKCIHKVNHVMISPNGRQFVFLHRYYIGKRKFDRLMVADAAGEKVRVVSDYGMASHYFWADEKTILGYMRGPGDKDGYWLVDLETGTFINFANGALDKYGDGHPHVWGDWFVTDTYPDKARMQHLILANWKTLEIRELGEFFHGFEYSGETRCDLHPRFSSNGKNIFFDSVFSGQRKLYKMDLDS